MAASAAKDDILAASAYERLHVPSLFDQWPARLLARARVRRGERVLDVACGTGILAREAAAAVGPDGFVAGVDPDPGMLAVARELAPAIEWRQGVAEALPFPDGDFDAVVSQFGLMFFTDRTQALREMARTLAPGGRIAIAVWDALENCPGFSAEVALLEDVAGSRAADALRAPFALGDRTELFGLVQAAGWQASQVTTEHGTARFPSIRAMVEADLRGWLPVMGIVLAEDQIEMILTEAERALADFVTERGTVEFVAPAHIVSGIRAAPGRSG